MPARDLYHDTVKNALVKDGWTITHDPLRLPWGRRDLFVDLGAEKLLAAEKAGQRIAVEIKSFTGPSLIHDLQNAIGQFVVYRAILATQEPDRALYLAVSDQIMSDLWDEQVAELLFEHDLAQIVVFNPKEEVIVKWKP